MKIKVNEDTVVEIQEGYKKSVLKSGMVYCYQMDCIKLEKLDCADCCLNNLADSIGMEYSKVKAE